MKLNMSLFSLGFRRGTIHEVIVTTFDSSMKPHAAPMGASIRRADELILRPFVDTDTVKTLRTARCGVVNVTLDPSIFYRTAFKKEPWVKPIARTWFEQAKTVAAPRLKCSDSYIEFEVIAISGRGLRRVVRCKVLHTECHERRTMPYCRSTFATIEGIIHATRVREFLQKGVRGKARKLIDMIRYYGELVERVAPKSKEARMLHELNRRFKNPVDPI